MHRLHNLYRNHNAGIVQLFVPLRSGRSSVNPSQHSAASVLHSLRTARLIGHRGLAGLAPENTMAAFAAAADAGLRWVELDAKLCASGELVVLHDNKVDRTSNGHGRAEHMDWATLRQLDAGSWFDARFAGERIPLLSDVLAFCAERGIGINIELKPNPHDYVATARVLAALLRAGNWLDRLPLLASSFSRQSLRAIQRYLPALPRGFLLERRWPEAAILAELEALQAVSFHYDDALISSELIAAVRASGRDVLIWTVNDDKRADALMRLGVSAVFSDLPLRLADSPGSATS